ncbi:MAG: DUF2723 domain-containing protein [Paramuribaculum sp.]|nr:DUF2723 domain-containing protein [Paramuribaculum sp.]
MKRYNLLNDSIGWFCFLVAAVTYILTLEPTASFWDCPEFITQGYKLEVGHPPGNPIFMLTARFFANFAFGDVTKVAYMVNLMSGLLSAATILLLFWTITHLVKKLIVADDAIEVSPVKMIVIFGSGVCGALMYAWSDTFWFSAVEGEVYAFSSFCTALVFWLILKWENRADMPHSDKYLILIAYVIGISIAVHLLNLLCIPAIVLVFYFKKCRESNLRGAVLALVLSFVIVGLILYGLVPGFVEMAQYFELFFVNVCGLSFNMGVLLYALIFVGVMAWSIYNLYAQRSSLLIKISVVLGIVLSGMLFIGNSLWIPVVLTLALVAYLIWCKKLHVRVLTLTMLSILVIFIGYSSYALLLIRSSAHTPMNQNAPDNVFALSSYLNREQYGDRPLIYGETMESTGVQELLVHDTPDGKRDLMVRPKLEDPQSETFKVVKTDPSEPDRYVTFASESRKKAVLTPKLNGFFPRMYSSDKKREYTQWIGENYDQWRARTMIENPVEDTVYTFSETLYSDPVMRDYLRRGLRQTDIFPKPTFADHLQYFLNYQFNHMYWRYFMWNFAGRQNDLQGNGEVNRGNWISGIPFIDDARLGDQSLLPPEMGDENPGHNVFFMLPLLLGLLGLVWQALVSKRGIEQFWVIFFLFFMTGIAIVVYLNQVPSQPRERDYAFAGSFYAYAIWVGMGVAALWRLIINISSRKELRGEPEDSPQADTLMYAKWKKAAIIAGVVGILVPLQVVSQTWDDHDRSGRYTTRDYGMNYLNSLDPNAIIFTNGDNDTFPLWYAQEVEGVRTDVKVVNLSYLSTDWYIDQLRRPSYDAPGIEFTTKPEDYAYGRVTVAYSLNPDDTPVTARQSLLEVFSPEAYNEEYRLTELKHPNWYIPTDTAALMRTGHFTPEQIAAAESQLEPVNARRQNAYGLNTLMALDIIDGSASRGWDRPVYFAMTVPNDYYLGLTPYMWSTGLAHEVTPMLNVSGDGNEGINVDKMYENVTQRFRWGGLDSGKHVYLDETVRQMVNTNRLALMRLAEALYNEGIDRLNSIIENPQTPDADAIEAEADDYLLKSREILHLLEEKLPRELAPTQIFFTEDLASLYASLGVATGEKDDFDRAKALYEKEIDRQTGYLVYFQSLPHDKYATLDIHDRKIEGYAFLNLLQGYGDFLMRYYAIAQDKSASEAEKLAAADIEALEKNLTTVRGLNLNRQYSIYQNQINKE